MKPIKFILIFSFLIACGNKTDLDELVKFDNLIRTHNLLEQFGMHHINNKLFKEHLNSDTISNELRERLADYKLNENSYYKLQNEMNKIGLKTYVRMEDCSVYITSGSFARRYGLLIDHSNTNRSKDKFNANGRFPINVGEKIKDNIYPIWTD